MISDSYPADTKDTKGLLFLSAFFKFYFNKKKKNQDKNHGEALLKANAPWTVSGDLSTYHPFLPLLQSSPMVPIMVKKSNMDRNFLKKRPVFATTLQLHLLAGNKTVISLLTLSSLQTWHANHNH